MKERLLNFIHEKVESRPMLKRFAILRRKQIKRKKMMRELDKVARIRLDGYDVINVKPDRFDGEEQAFYEKCMGIMVEKVDKKIKDTQKPAVSKPTNPLVRSLGHLANFVHDITMVYIRGFIDGANILTSAVSYIATNVISRTLSLFIPKSMRPKERKNSVDIVVETMKEARKEGDT